MDDLALPLYGCVSAEARRFAAAALSEVPHAPVGLARRLANEPVEISAPLLVRGEFLTDIDLVALIGRHGMAHARVIARRRRLNPRIAELIRALEAASVAIGPDGVNRKSASGEESPVVTQTRHRLLAMMRPAGDPVQDDAANAGAPGNEDVYPRLRATALTGSRPLFHTALAEALEIDPAKAHEVLEADEYSNLAAALRSLSLSEEQAFLLAMCARPLRFGNGKAIGRFIETYRAVDFEQASRTVCQWRRPSSASGSTPSAADLNRRAS
ncbi:hypothetical protein [Aquamicrobium sp. LC103]|uniref:hypothetical protein n=1 Tax=Aquamicrobium sp. LC103 TaxID=1120658 RepID=UPI001FEE53A5|nr:hypothetical protein [Aquamicrobium sp. LC103]